LKVIGRSPDTNLSPSTFERNRRRQWAISSLDMTLEERELESARRRLLARMEEPQGHQSLAEIRQELRAIDAEMEHLKKVGQILPPGSGLISPAGA
jgi:hypothetical protein